MKGIPSPFGSSVAGLEMQARMTVDLLRVHGGLMRALDKHGMTLEQLSALAQTLKEHSERIQALPAGPKGEKGDPGDNTPVKGVDYFTDADKNELVSAIIPLLPQPKHGKSPKKGTDYFTKEDVLQIANIVRAQIALPTIDEDALTEKAAKKVRSTISTKDLKGYEDADVVLRKYIARGSLHGGGDIVEAGSNVTITTQNGKKVISATSSAPSALTPTGTVNGVNATFGVASQPSSVIADGITYFEGHGYSYAALVITLDIAPSQYIRYYA